MLKLFILLLLTMSVYSQTITSVHTEHDRKYYVEMCKDEVIKQYSDEVSERELLDLLQECELDAQ